MKRRKLKGFVLPTLYLLITISIFVGVVLLGRDMVLTNKDYDYGVGALKDEVQSVIIEDTIVSSEIASPVEEGKADIAVHFYSKDADETLQQSSLIYYENTYLPNTGIIYASDSAFDVRSVFNGKVTDITDDEFFGKCLVIEHNNKLRTYYYGLDNIQVKKDDEVTNETILGTAKNNEIMNDKKTFMFEVYLNNELKNPESIIGTKITDYDEN